MANDNLYLIGTHHMDLKGPSRLEGLLGIISPDIVALEFHEDREPSRDPRKNIRPEEEGEEADRILKEVGLALNKQQRNALLERGREIGSVWGYEFTASKAYTDANPESRLEYLDISVFENGVQKFQEGYFAMLKKMFEEIAQEPESREQFLEMLSSGKEGFLQQHIRGGRQRL